MNQIAENTVDSENTVNSFDDLDLSPVMRRALKKAGFTTPSPIQAQLIPLAMEGEDVIGQARTGTGKTAAFAIPILEQLDSLEDCRDPQVIVVVPTRELADQVGKETERLAWGVETEVAVLAGGKNINRQLRQLENGVQIVVGTPGRLHDHLQRKSLRTGSVWCVVLDEADRMLDIGFRPQIERILRKCPRDRQTLLLSATLPPTVRRLAESYMVEPGHRLPQDEMAVETIEQRYFTVANDRKSTLLDHLLKRENPEQAVYSAEQNAARTGCTDNSVTCMTTVAGTYSSRGGSRFVEFAGSNGKILATDVVGRGIDISTISHIINYDVPQDCDDYVHWWVEPAEWAGKALPSPWFPVKEKSSSIEQRINKELKRDSIEGFEAVALPPKTVEPDKPEQPAKKRLNPMHWKVKRRRCADACQHLSLQTVQPARPLSWFVDSDQSVDWTASRFSLFATDNP